VPEIVHVVPQALLHAAEANPHKQFYVEAVLIYAATLPAPEVAAVTFQSVKRAGGRQPAWQLPKGHAASSGALPAATAAHACSICWRVHAERPQMCRKDA